MATSFFWVYNTYVVFTAWLGGISLFYIYIFRPLLFIVLTMTVGSGISIDDGKLSVLGTTTILSDVDDRVVLTPTTSAHGAFLGVAAGTCGGGCSHCVFPIGKLQGLRFMCLFRFKLWWMTQRMGSSASDIPFETQFLLIEGPASHTGKPVDYTVFLPLVDASFRSVLQGNTNNEIEICVQSGDPTVDAFEGTSLVFVGTGTDPFDVITDSVKSVEKHLQTFSHRETKQLPDMLNWFGWCTWDAFYTDVSTDGIRRGLRSFKEGGVLPRFFIIDDGWQTVEVDRASLESKAYNTANFANRLTDIKENHKFREDADDGKKGLTDIVAEIKQEHHVKYVYVWHAMTGYWGGVRPGAMTEYRSEISYPVSSPGVQPNQPCAAFDSIATNGLGLVHPEEIFNFYDDLHSYLASAGVDGVKVDVQNILETLGGGHGGRVKLAGKFHRALEASVASNFPGNGIISCMSHNTDSLYHAKSNAVIRASDDFFPNDPASHTIHVASVAYNTVFLGEFMQPDWDMFHSLHPMAEYHGAARAVGGCPIYVSDKPGCHDFDLLKKLVLPDGSILRAKLPGRPTGDCLFSDPARDNRSLLKIWNVNDCTGVIGAFNCQGAGWCRVGKMNLIHDDNPAEMTGTIQPKDIPHLSRLAGGGWNGDSVIYSHRSGALKYLHHDEILDVTLKSKEYEIFTVVPVKEKLASGGGGVCFGAIGLVDMFNSGGAVKETKFEEEEEEEEDLGGGGAVVTVKLRGCGRFGAYASVGPKRIQLDSEDVGFEYDDVSGLVVFVVGEPKEELYISVIDFQF